MKTISPILALAVVVTLAAGCAEAPTEPEVPQQATITPPPPRAPIPQEIRIPVRSGILDFGAYERWLKEPPVIVQINPLDRNTAALLARKVDLAEIILSDPAPARGPDHQPAVDRLKNRAPAPSSVSFYDRQRNPPETVTLRTQQHVIDNYSRRWAGLTVENISSIVTQLERQQQQDVQLYQGNASTTSRSGAQATANLNYVRAWGAVLRDARQQIDLINAPTAPSDREKALAEWMTFQQNDLPILRRMINENQIGRHFVAEDGAYEIEGEGDLLIHFQAGSAELFYPINGKHRFRLFGDKKELITRVVETASTE